VVQAPEVAETPVIGPVPSRTYASASTAQAPAESKVKVPDDKNGVIKGTDTTDETEDSATNWTPWIILFILIILAGGATGGYFYWSSKDGTVVVSKKKSKSDQSKKRTKVETAAEKKRKIKRW
jgi:flagellar basal body-associated protein FliL